MNGSAPLRPLVLLLVSSLPAAAPAAAHEPPEEGAGPAPDERLL